MTPRQIANRDGQLEIYDRRLVSIVGHVRDVSKQPQGETLLMESESTLFHAKLDHHSSEEIKDVIEGSMVRLSGICLVESDEWGGSISFSILLRSRDDIFVLQAPPWWTVKRTVAVLAALGLVVSASLGWAVTAMGLS
jgi:hypothetical protein